MPGVGNLTTDDLAVVETVITTLPEPLNEAGLKLQVVPVGNPLQLKGTFPTAGPICRPIVYCAGWPAITVTPGVFEMMETGGFTVTVKLAELFVPLLPPPAIAAKRKLKPGEIGDTFVVTVITG